MTSEEPTSDGRTAPIRADGAPAADTRAGSPDRAATGGGAGVPASTEAAPSAPAPGATPPDAAHAAAADVSGTAADTLALRPAGPASGTPAGHPTAGAGDGAVPAPPVPAPVSDGFLPTTSPPVPYPNPPSLRDLFPDLLPPLPDPAPQAPAAALPLLSGVRTEAEGTAAAPPREPENPAASTRELPRIPADPATATALYQSRVAAPRSAGGGRRGGNALLWVAGGLCTLGMLAGVTLAAGIVEIQTTATGNEAGALPAPAAPQAPAPTAAPPSATVPPTPRAPVTRAPTPRPTGPPASVPPRRAGDTVGALRSFSTRLCATAGRGRVAGGGTQVLQNPCTDGGEQWRLTQESGRFTIIHAATGRCLDAPTDGDLASVALAPCAQDDSQRWRLGVEGNVFAIANVATSRCLDVPGGVPVNGLVLAQFACNGSAAQTWQMITVAVR
ncbi:MAG TPA: RICIN domain-containing protein [Pilimelia sp.]|nr:RICIN domain-containing protein [Pilimelia sp.]